MFLATVVLLNTVATTTARPSGSLHQITSSDDATISYRLRERRPWYRNATATVVILPGYTSTAEQVVSWFGPAFDAIAVRTVAIDYRGFGGSTGSYAASASPTDVVYEGLRISRLAMDAREVLRDLETRRGVTPEKTVLLGHSMGVAVWCEFLSLFGTDKYAGFAMIDQPPKFTFGAPRAADHTFPDDFSDHDELGTWKFGLHHSTLGQFARGAAEAALDHQDGSYPRVKAKYDAVFLSWNGCNDNPELWTDPTSLCYGFGSTMKACCVTQDQRGLDVWKAATDGFEAINGKLDGILGFNDLMQDYTDVMTLIRRRGLPVFVYGGEYSLVPEEYMRWVWAVAGPGSPSSRSLFFTGSQGVHAPFLNSDGSAEIFLDALATWVRDVAAAPKSASRAEL